MDQQAINKLKDEQALITRILRELRLPSDEFFLNGSGALACFGVPRERPMGDLDIFMTTNLWFDCLRVWDPLLAAPSDKYWALVVPDRRDPRRRCDPPILRKVVHGLTVDVFLNWRRRSSGNFDPALYLNNVQHPMGAQAPCAPLQFIMDWKLGQGRNKDLLDVVSIRHYLGVDGEHED